MIILLFNKYIIYSNKIIVFVIQKNKIYISSNLILDSVIIIIQKKIFSKLGSLKMISYVIVPTAYSTLLLLLQLHIEMSQAPTKYQQAIPPFYSLFFFLLIVKQIITLKKYRLHINSVYVSSETVFFCCCCCALNSFITQLCTIRSKLFNIHTHLVVFFLSQVFLFYVYN